MSESIRIFRVVRALDVEACAVNAAADFLHRIIMSACDDAKLPVN